jgi:hypothetical protein
MLGYLMPLAGNKSQPVMNPQAAEVTRSPRSLVLPSDFQRRSYDLHAMSAEDSLNFTGRRRPSQPADFQKEILHIASWLVGNQQSTLPVTNLSLGMRDVTRRKKRIPMGKPEPRAERPLPSMMMASRSPCGFSICIMLGHRAREARPVDLEFLPRRVGCTSQFGE